MIKNLSFSLFCKLEVLIRMFMIAIMSEQYIVVERWNTLWQTKKVLD